MDNRSSSKFSSNKNTYRHSSKNTITKPNVNTTTITATTATTDTITTQRRFKVIKRSSDKPASAQTKPSTETKPANIVTDELSCGSSAKADLTKTNNRNYSTRNMLRNSRLAISNDIAGPSHSSASYNGVHDESSLQNLDSLQSYTRLSVDCDCFIYELPDKTVCLLCGKRVKERSIAQHIDSDYHFSQYRKLDLKLLNENLDESSLQMRTIEVLCNNWYSNYSLTDDLIELRNQAIRDFEQILGSINPECHIRIHGSMYYSAATRESDINLEIVHPNSKLFESDPRSKKSIHHKLIDPDAEYGNQFNQHTMHYDLASNPVETLYNIYRIVASIDSSKSSPLYPFTVTSSLNRLSRKVPSITLRHRMSGTNLEVICYSGRRFHLARLLRLYTSLDYRAEQLCTLVKIWARLCGIDDPDKGSYPPHAYVIMMIYYLQRTEPPVLPCLHEIAASRNKATDALRPDQTNIDRPDEVTDKTNGIREDDLEDEEEDLSMSGIDEDTLKDLNWVSQNKTPVHKLFIQFFKSMMDEFAMISNVITITTLERVNSRTNAQSKAIEHPTNREINISRSIASLKTFDFIKDCFFHTYFYLTAIPIDANLKPKKLIGDDPRDYTRLYVNTSRLDSYVAMKGPSIGQADYDSITQMIQQKLFTRDVETLYALSVNDQRAMLPRTLANLYDQSLLSPQSKTHSYSCQLCRATGHTRDKCPKAIVERLRSEDIYMDFDIDERVNLDSSLMKLYKDEAISPQLSTEHNRILSTLKRIVNEALDSNLSFVLYGSTVNNLGSRDSDLDICVTVKDNPTGKDVDCVDILKSIQKVLETIIEVHEIRPVFSARVPIIRFKYNDFDIDLSMYNQCAIYNSKLLKAYSLINHNVAPLCSLVKKFAKACRIADASEGSLSSYAWSLLAIYYLQQIKPPVLPVLQEPVDSPVRGCFGVNGWNVWFHDKPVRLPEHPFSLTQLLKGFFLFYATFDFENTVVAIRKSTQINKFQKSWNGCMIAIEDPFELTYNLANRLSDQMATFIQNSFAQTYRHIVKIQNIIMSNGESLSRPNRLAKRLFDGREITKVAPPLRGCLICHKIGHKLKECPERNNDPQRSPRKDQRGGFNAGKWKP